MVSGGVLSAAMLLACSGLLALYRHGDARFDPNNADRFLKPMTAALEAVQCGWPGSGASIPCDDALLVPDPILTDYFLNYLAGPLVWYSVEPRPVDDRLMEQLLARYGRIWLARDRNAQSDDAEERRGWERVLTERAYKVDERKFGDWARLLRFSAAGRPAEFSVVDQRLGDMILDSVRLGIEQQQGVSASETGRTDPADSDPLDDGKVRTRTGATLQVGLTWRAAEQPAGNYTVFVQLLDGASQVKAQRDRWPGDGFYPTAALNAGQTITDNVALPLDVPPGSYRLIAGLYRGDQPGLPRLTGPGGDHVVLAQVDVK
jgi:hypothetical protein